MLLLVAAAVAVGIVLYALFINRIKGLPPGPPPFPLIGNMLSIGAQPLKKVEEWKAKYGPVFTVWMPNPTVFITNKETLRESLIQQGEVFAGRPSDVESMKLLLGGNYGLALEENDVWKEQRRFALHSLKELGFRSARLQDTISGLASDAVERMKETGGQPVELRPFFTFAVANVIWDLAFGRVVSFGDPLFQQVQKHLDVVMQLLVHPSMLLLSIHPKLLAALDSLLGGALKKKVDANDEVLEILKNVGSFTRHQLIMASYALWTAGFETTITSLRFAIHRLINNPRVQKKMQKEIDENVGTKSIRMEDQKALPYCCAVIQEVLRIGSESPARGFNFTHHTLGEATVGGYHIPAGIDVVPEFQLVHHDENEFERPLYFCPERHITDGAEFFKDPRVTPFSLGKRACLGESLARMELFIFLTTFVQQFTFKSPTLIPPELKESTGFIKSPLPYKVLIVPRLFE